MVTDLPEIGRRDQSDQAKQNEWNQRQNDGRHATVGAERPHLHTDLRAIAQQARQPSKNLGQVAAGLALNIDRHDQKQEIVLAYSAIQIVDGGADVLTEGNFVGGQSEFGADRIRHLLRHQIERGRQRIAGAKSAHQHIDAVGQQLGKAPDPSLPHYHEEEANKEDRKKHGGPEGQRPVSEHKPQKREQQRSQRESDGQKEISIKSKPGLRQEIVVATQPRALEFG